MATTWTHGAARPLEHVARRQAMQVRRRDKALSSPVASGNVPHLQGKLSEVANRHGRQMHPLMGAVSVLSEAIRTAYQRL